MAIARPARWALIFMLVAWSAACGGGGGGSGFEPPPEPVSWTWQALGGPPAPKSPQVSNHEPLVVAGETIVLGTGDGVWRRPLDANGAWERSGLAGFSVHALRSSGGGSRLVAVGLDPADVSAPTAHYSTDGGLSWTAASAWPQPVPGTPSEGDVFAMYSLEADPADPAVLYAGLAADTVAVTVDGGATWVLADGATEPNFGYACVPHRPADANVLLQGCELPLDVAWIGARDVLPADRFSLPNFRFLFGGEGGSSELTNRRINAMAAVPGRSDQVFVGVEGGLVELTSQSGAWLGRADTFARWVWQVPDQGTTEFPYAYITSVVVFDSEAEHSLFGGYVNGENEVLSLFETFDGGPDVRRLAAGASLTDPRVEQLVRLGPGDVLLVLTQPAGADLLGDRLLTVFRLTRP